MKKKDSKEEVSIEEVIWVNREMHNARELYKRVFEMDYKTPIRFSIYKLMSTIIILLFCGLLFLSPMVKEWVALIISIGFISICFSAFYFIGNIEYPNGDYNIYEMALSIAFVVSFVIFCFFLRKIMLSNIYNLDCYLKTEVITEKTYNKAKNLSNTFVIIAGVFTLGLSIFGIVFGRKKFATMMSTLIVFSGMCFFLFIANFAFAKDLLQKISGLSSGGSTFLQYLILISSIIIMCVYDVAVMILAKIIGIGNHK